MSKWPCLSCFYLFPFCFQDCFHAKCVTYTCKLPRLHVEQHVVIYVNMEVHMTTMAKYKASSGDDTP